MLSNILLHSNSGMNLYLASQGKDKLNSNNDYTMNKIMNISLGVNKYSISPYYTDNIGNIKLL